MRTRSTALSNLVSIPTQGKLDTDDLVLPDDVEVQGDSGVRWAAGAMDGVASVSHGHSKAEDHGETSCVAHW